MGKRQNKWVKRKLAELRLARGNKCAYCGSIVDLEFAHVHDKNTRLNGRSRGMIKRYYDIKKNPDCYVLLCGKKPLSCHVRYDRGEITASIDQDLAPLPPNSTS